MVTDPLLPTGTGSVYGDARLWGWAGVFGLAFYFSALAGDYLSVPNEEFVSFWLPSGLYLATLVVAPRRVWPLLVGAAFIANLVFDWRFGTPLWAGLCFCSANALQALVGACLLQRSLGGQGALFSLRNFSLFLLIGVVLAPTVGASIGTATLVQAGFSTAWGESWKTWWGSNAMAILLFSPLLLCWLDPGYRHPAPLRARSIAEAIALYGGMIATTWYLLSAHRGIVGPYDPRLILFLLWAGLRFGPRGASAAAALFAAFATYLLVQGYAGVPPEKLSAPEYVFAWQLFLGINALVALVPSIVVCERDRTLHALHRSENAVRELNADLERRVNERTIELQEANRELEAFSYSVSHDLRAPLRHISSFAEMLKAGMGPLNAEAARHFERIAGAVRRMSEIIEGLLKIARLSRSELRQTEIGLDAMVADARAQMAFEHKDRDIEWTVDPLPRIRGDEGLLFEVVDNLLSNAVKFTQYKDKARIHVGSAPQYSNAGEAVFFVRDNGAGFDMRYVGKLFGICQRLHSDNEFEGTGVGLANVQRIVQRHGGRVWADATVEAGATFYVALPAASGI